MFVMAEVPKTLKEDIVRGRKKEKRTEQPSKGQVFFVRGCRAGVQSFVVLSQASPGNCVNSRGAAVHKHDFSIYHFKVEKPHSVAVNLRFSLGLYTDKMLQMTLSSLLPVSWTAQLQGSALYFFSDHRCFCCSLRYISSGWGCPHGTWQHVEPT